MCKNSVRSDFYIMFPKKIEVKFFSSPAFQAPSLSGFLAGSELSLSQTFYA